MYDFLKSKTALYIEDELSVLRNISSLLKTYFDHFYIATDGEMGYKLYKEKKIDVLLVDIELPKINGIDFIKHIRKENSEIPIIVISAYTKTDYLLESIELNLAKYIVKPLTTKKIHELLTLLNNDFSNGNIIQVSTGVLLHVKEMKVTFNTSEYPLTNKEFKILKILSSKKVITYDQIYALWNEEIPSKNAIRSCFKQLRKKLPDNIIKNKNGVGYYLETATE